MLRKTISAQTFSCRNGTLGFSGAGWLGWRTKHGISGLVFWGKLTRLQVGYLAQQLRAFTRSFDTRPAELVIDVLALELDHHETGQALRQLGAMPDLSPHAQHMTLLVSHDQAATATQHALSHWSPPDRVGIQTNLDDVYNRLGILQDSELCEQMKHALNHPPQADFTKNHLETYVSKHLARPNIGDACTELNLTRRTLQRRLYEAGTSFQKVVIDTRIKFAQQLLSESQLPITQIAVDVGFATLQAFSSAFRRETGLSPSSYRSASQKVPETGQLNGTSTERNEPAADAELDLGYEDARPITIAPPSGTHRISDAKIAAIG